MEPSTNESGTFETVAHIIPPPKLMSPPLPGILKAVVLVACFALVSIRVTDPSPWLSVQTAPTPAVRNRGPGPVGTVARIVPVEASTLVTSDPSARVTQIWLSL